MVNVTVIESVLCRADLLNTFLVSESHKDWGKKEFCVLLVGSVWEEGFKA